ncbi:C4-dicarboxylate transport sensor protein DctB [Aquimixticola soesokkakensis]|uniref:C4-dicarboxylate transport sensor protein DctB n=1 Tax=Aquimixticola soesokkakensis TaxID=1519096 RepID=A0A1Y5TD08_9RHOB|nr:ATP-binding protein [Aquimixticola soesokkakensis]SLN57654.1 C4-dicarboxylate transport sensor protein DctB [Aquimixticola soesokkakensis]
MPVLSRRVAVVLIFAALLAVFTVGVWQLSYRSTLDQAAARGRASMTLAADRLTGALKRYREIAVILSDHPSLHSLVVQARPDAVARAGAHDLLVKMADKTGTQSITVVGRDGVMRASSSGLPLPAGVAPAVTRALEGALGAAHFVDEAGQRRYVHAAPIFDGAGPAVGAIVVSTDVAGIEWGWPVTPSAVFFTDDSGVVFVTNLTELVLAGSAQRPFPLVAQTRVGAHLVWRLDGGPYIPDRALYLTQEMPVVGFTGALLLDVAPVRALAWRTAGMAAALCLAFGALLFLATERRRALAMANRKLEARVQARTSELRRAIAELTREVGERTRAEAQLTRAQADLVQAGKLSALGQMSAGISHELNQPLMAIRSFAENAALFVERDQPDKAAQNLLRISELARRMGRIIKNLRAFARQEPEALTDVELRGVVEAALEMANSKIAAAQVQVDFAQGPKIWARGGEVRLQQVVLNLMSNAVDAMVGQAHRVLTITLDGAQQSGMVRLSIADTGSGISDPDRIFDPFYTTKEVGAAEGMGLGLSISYGLVQGFGGQIRGRNKAQGGAQFDIDLQPARAFVPVAALQKGA